MRFIHKPNGVFRTSAAVTAIAASALVAGVASAQDFSGSIGVSTENVGKGLGKSGGDPSLSASAELSHGDFYAGLSASSVDIAQGADTEFVTTIGYSPRVGAYSFDLSAMHKTLSGSASGYDNQFMEYQADMSRNLGPVGLRLRVNYSPDGSGPTKEAWWLEAQAGVALGSRTRATVALGERITDGGADYVAWNLGMKRKLTDAFALDVRWYDTDSHALGERYDGRLVGALSVAF
ncbi:TorF family putative porin [Brevundimonas vesicularis]|uniref:TorF family putative porin n=1 Tax=Brevundimonas vesicularis TaxID=41276 RepID=UPI0038D5155D